MRALPGRESRTTIVAPPPAVKRSASGEAQRARIRRATGELVAKRGYAGTSIELIIKRARVSYKTFYRHYANKEEAFVDLFDTALERTEQLIRDVIAESELPWPEQVALALRTFFEAILTEPLIARACLVEGPTVGPALLGRYDQVNRAFVPILRRGREGRPEAADLPQSLEETLAGAVLWAAYQRLGFSEIDRIPELIPENIELVLRPYVGEAEAVRVAREGAASAPDRR